MRSMDNEKEIRWMGSAYSDLLAFPPSSRQEAGFQLGKVQAGLEPTDWKPFDTSVPEPKRYASKKKAASTECYM